MKIRSSSHPSRFSRGAERNGVAAGLRIWPRGDELHPLRHVICADAIDDAGKRDVIGLCVAVPGVDVDLWYAFFVPAKTPAAVVQRLNSLPAILF